MDGFFSVFLGDTCMLLAKKVASFRAVSWRTLNAWCVPTVLETGAITQMQLLLQQSLAA